MADNRYFEIRYIAIFRWNIIGFRCNFVCCSRLGL